MRPTRTFPYHDPYAEISHEELVVRKIGDMISRCSGTDAQMVCSIRALVCTQTPPACERLAQQTCERSCTPRSAQDPLTATAGAA